MPTVSNTSPLLNLAIIGRLDLLRSQFGSITIPPSVLQELRIQEDLPGSVEMRTAVGDGWIRVQEAMDGALVRLLQRDLDKGEAEAIALALQLNAKWTLLDEREGRKTAKDFGLKVTGTLGILLRDKQEGNLPSIHEAMIQLREKAGFHIGSALFTEILIKIGEFSCPAR